MIALNLGQAALAAGFTVRFSTLAAALADLLAQESLPAFERRIRRHTSPDLLILPFTELEPGARATDLKRAFAGARMACRTDSTLAVRLAAEAGLGLAVLPVLVGEAKAIGQ
jgi:DNA-binding transcriptional LysR family regulator